MNVTYDTTMQSALVTIGLLVVPPGLLAIDASERMPAMTVVPEHSAGCLVDAFTVGVVCTA